MDLHNQLNPVPQGASEGHDGMPDLTDTVDSLENLTGFEKKVTDVYRYLHHHMFPEGYNASQRLNLKRYASKFTLKDGTLYRTAKEKDLKVVNTMSEAISVFKQFHALGSGGHSGIVKTRLALTSRFYWPGMCAQISEWVSSCEDCQKGGEIINVDPILHSIKVSKTWELVGIDLLGPLNTTKEGYRYILTATDYFSKWVYAYPMKNKSALEVADNLATMIYEQGCPQRILSDQGSEFVNKLNMNLCKSLGIDRSVAAAYHPQTNGLDEKTNHNIKRALLKVVNDKQNNWDRFLKPIVFSLRSKKHCTTKVSPFKLMYGREAVYPCELPETYLLEQIIMAEEKDYEVNEEEQHQLREITRAKALENVAVAQSVQQKTYSKRVLKKSKNVSVNINDMVLVLNNRKKGRQGGPLEPKYQGPYKVRCLEGKKVYLETLEGQQLKRMVSINHVKPYIQSLIPMQNTQVMTYQEGENTGTYVAAKPQDSSAEIQLKVKEDDIQSFDTGTVIAAEKAPSMPLQTPRVYPRLEAVVGPFKIYDTSMQCLQNGSWISDEVIDAYLHVLVRSSKSTAVLQAVTCCVATSILSGRYRKASYRQFPLHDSNILLCPHNTGNHWIIVIITVKDQYLLVIDPLGLEQKHSRRILQNWRNFLRRHYPDEKITSGPWTIDYRTHPQQMDSVNCGPLILKFAEAYLSDGNLSNVKTQTSDMDEFRVHIAQELLKNSSNLEQYCLACNIKLSKRRTDAKNIQCTQCKRWIHLECLSPGSDNKKLQLQKVHFSCDKCTNT